jgi:type I restriction enzyme S subunit
LTSLENGQAQWKRYIYGQGRPHLSFEQLRMTAILLPPFAEQQRIIAEVERRLSVVEEIETVVNANFQRGSRLRQSVLQEAFEGRLVRRERLSQIRSDRQIAAETEPPSEYDDLR